MERGLLLEPVKTARKMNARSQAMTEGLCATGTNHIGHDPSWAHAENLDNFGGARVLLCTSLLLR